MNLQINYYITSIDEQIQFHCYYIVYKFKIQDKWDTILRLNASEEREKEWREGIYYILDAILN